MTQRIRPPEERFWAKVPERPEEGCWEWRGTRQNAGYGYFYDGERKVGAHRFVCEVTYGPSAGRHALHACDNPGCVRPDHLRWGTRSENMADAVRRGRWWRTDGELSPVAKLTWLQVEAIRSRGSEPQAALAREFGVSQPTISLILLNKRWRKT